mmetsp:Transcript_14535/g.58966  ORF Transcript_14535/g.58966 Transcript_14535/m.58966 type:complete len:283 (+) Transcript_14535:1953-2801(+)
MAYAIRRHDLGSSQLILGSVNVLPEKLVQGHVTSKNDGPIRHLNRALSESHQVCTNPNRSSSHIAESEYIIVSAAGFSSYFSTPAKILNSNTVDRTDNVIEDPSCLAVYIHRVDICFVRLHLLVVLISEVQILEAEGRFGVVLELDLELALQLRIKPNPSSRVARQIYSGDSPLSSKLRGLEEHIVFTNSERTCLEGDVIRNNYNFASFRVLRSLQLDKPGNHANIIRTRRPYHAFKLICLEIEDKFFGLQNGTLWHLQTRELLPRFLHRHFKQTNEVVNVC